MSQADLDALFREIVDSHMGILLKTAHGFAAGAADRDELVQEMLIATWQALPAFNGQCKLSTFLYRVVHNRALNWQRSRSRYRRKLQHFSDAPHLAIETSGAETDAAKLEWLYATIRELPPLDRTLVMLQLDHLTQREIADITGLTESNVGVRLHRIKQALMRQKPKTPHEL